MDMFNATFIGTVDLDDEKTYKDFKWKNFNTSDLDQEIRHELGWALLYLQFLQADIDFGKQVDRVNQWCFLYAHEWLAHYNDTPVNRKWYKKLLYKILDETENLC
jgi:hypothetical protein